VISAEIARYGDRLRDMQVAALSRLLQARGGAAEAFPPVAVAVLISSVSLFLRMEEGIGMSAGHAETEALVERWLGQLEGAFGDPAPASPATA
jgi:hypothetical protein